MSVAARLTGRWRRVRAAHHRLWDPRQSCALQST